MLTPSQFMDEFVRPTVDEWIQEPLSISKAVVAASQIDILADQFVLHQNPRATANDLRNLFRDSRNNESEKAFQLIRDVRDTHKYGPLGRASATIRNGQRPT